MINNNNQKEMNPEDLNPFFILNKSLDVLRLDT